MENPLEMFTATPDEKPHNADNAANVAVSDEMIARISAALHLVDDPELGVNIVDLGLVYGVDVRPDGFVTVTMTLTTPGCPMHASLADGVGPALSNVAGVTGGQIHLVWEPRWTPDMLTAEGRAALGY